MVLKRIFWREVFIRRRHLYRCQIIRWYVVCFNRPVKLSPLGISWHILISFSSSGSCLKSKWLKKGWHKRKKPCLIWRVVAQGLPSAIRVGNQLIKRGFKTNKNLFDHGNKWTQYISPVNYQIIMIMVVGIISISIFS